MDIIHATPMTFGFLTWPLRPPQLTLVLVVKATFDIVKDGSATMAESPRQCHGPVYFDDDTEASLRLDSDFALLKRSGECLLAGTCHPPEPTGVSAVRFTVGELEKTIIRLEQRRSIERVEIRLMDLGDGIEAPGLAEVEILTRQ